MIDLWTWASAHWWIVGPSLLAAAFLYGFLREALRKKPADGYYEVVNELERKNREG